MKKIFSIFMIGLVLVMFSSCDTWLDVNDDPNNPSTASAELVFPVATLSVAAQVGGYYNLLGGFWSQYWTQSTAANQYKYIDSYTINATDFSNQWTELYAGALNDLAYIIREAEEAEDWSMYLMGTVMSCYTYQILADLYDKVPYFEATAGGTLGIFSPVYNTGQDIYDDLIIKLDYALSKDYKLTERSMSTDQVFNGDMDSWVKFANTLKLKIFMRQMDARASVAQAGIQKLYADGAEFLDVNAGLNIFTDEKFKDNPLYAANNRNLNVATNLRASATLNVYLDINGDPRFDYFYVNGGSTTPLPQGGFNIGSTVIDPLTVTIFALYPTTPVNFISASESLFLQAEAVAKGWGTGNDKALYDMAVLKSFTESGGFNGAAFVDGDGAYEYPVGGTFAEKQEAIIMQKWISMAGRNGIESFFETNRTGIPKISTIEIWDGSSLNSFYPGGEFTYSQEGVTGDGNFPKRLLIPQTERAANENVPADLLSKTITDKVWWAK